jgi:deoxyinosine 3'endonuclease (endonuclease V)
LKSSLSELRDIQRETAKKVVLEDRFEQPITSVAGVDLAFINETGIAACVATNYPPRRVLELIPTLLKTYMCRPSALTGVV